MIKKLLLLMLVFTFTTLFHGSRACEDILSMTTPLRHRYGLAFLMMAHA